MLYLEDNDAVSAETYIKKASSLLAACKVRGGWATIASQKDIEGAQGGRREPAGDCRWRSEGAAACC